MTDLNNVCLFQSLLWMEPDHPFVIARLAGVFLCALPAVRELYQYINDPRYGTWISLFSILCFSGLSWCPNRLTFFSAILRSQENSQNGATRLVDAGHDRYRTARHH